MARPAEESLESALESRLLSRGEQSELVKSLESTFRRLGEGTYGHVDRPKAIGIRWLEEDEEANGEETLTFISREELRDGTVGTEVKVRIRERDHVVDRVTHGILGESGPFALGENCRLTVQEAAVFEELVEHPEHFVRYNPDDEAFFPPRVSAG